ncbi:LLM class flavin-dependent oxidoreductase [Aldersonia kunmingensis]|uniref:LLM class flavin-dependent oxidoreductase n=1 Tax=Aldersonia kunmingensis TaxID=408066 RepID=UPI000833B9F9|nr:LLM class flavin-dependent oxidoreductase [Aldersonia kunmingensis]
MFTLRFDLRAPAFGAPAADLYAAAIDMCAWSESRGAALAVLSEHHGADDGHLPAPTLLASAIAARTSTLSIIMAAVVLPLWDPVRLAEEMAVLDLISKGRVIYALGIGHRAAEYEHFGIDPHRRGAMADEYLPLLLDLLRGNSVDYDGRRITVTPSCSTPAGPTVMIAGGSPAAARRAARQGLGLVSQTYRPELKDIYEAECRAHGHEPGFVQFPDPTGPTAVFVADDIDRAWDELGPHLQHDALMAASYRPGDDTVASISRARTVAELRAENGPYRIISVAEAAETVAGGRLLPLAPLCGGLAPEIAWRYLEHAANAVKRSRQSKEPATN